MPIMNNDFLDIRQIEAFSAVISLESVTGAARMLGRSQPAVTRLIQDLEASVGFELFHRNGPRLIPTEKGLAFSREVERFLVGLRLMRDRARTIGSDAPQMVSIACTQTFAAGIVPQALGRSDRAALPRRVYIEATLAEHARQSVLTRSADFGVVSLPISFSGIDVRFIGEMPCVAAVASDDPLAAEDVIRVSALSSRSLVTMADPLRMRRQIDAALAQAGVAPAEIVEVNTSVTALAAARAGLGVAIIEPSTGYGVPMQGVTVRPLDIDIPYYWALIAPGGSFASPLVEQIIADVRAVAESELPRLTFHDPSRHAAVMEAIYGAAGPAAKAGR